MLINFWFGCLHFGRPSGIDVFHHDAAVTLCLGWRGDVPPSELPWRRISRFSWNWLPDRIYEKIGSYQLALSPFQLLVAMISGRKPISQNAEELLPSEYANAVDSSRWTGRERKFIGFGTWRHDFVVYRATWRSLMHVYLTGQKERANPKHVLYVAPANELSHNMSKNDIPSEWKNADGSAKLFEIEFKHGRASVDERMGEWLIEKGYAQRSNIIRVTGQSMLGSLARTIAGR